MVASLAEAEKKVQCPMATLLGNCWGDLTARMSPVVDVVKSVSKSPVSRSVKDEARMFDPTYRVASLSLLWSFVLVGSIKHVLVLIPKRLPLSAAASLLQFLILVFTVTTQLILVFISDLRHVLQCTERVSFRIQFLFDIPVVKDNDASFPWVVRAEELSLINASPPLCDWFCNILLCFRCRGPRTENIL